MMLNRLKLGYECGIVIDGFSAFEAGDIIECSTYLKDNYQCHEWSV